MRSKKRNFYTSLQSKNKVNNHCNFCRNRLIHKGLCPYYVADQITQPIRKDIERIKKKWQEPPPEDGSDIDKEPPDEYEPEPPEEEKCPRCDKDIDLCECEEEWDEREY